MSDHPFITDYARRKMSQLGISESAVMDVYYHGTDVALSSGAKAMVRTYESSGVTIGVMYKLDQHTGRYLITSVWQN